MGANAVVTPATGDLSGLSSSGGDISSELGSLLGQGYDAATGTEEVPGGEQGTEPAPGGEAPPEYPAGEAPQAQAAEPAQTPKEPAQPGQAQTTSPEPYPVSQDGKSYLMPKGDYPALQQAQQYAQQVQEWFPDAESANYAYLRSADLRAMENDWIDGNPQALEGVLAHWSGANHNHNPAVQARFQQSFQRMAEMIPGMLERSNPQAYQSFIGAPARFDGQGNMISPASGLLAKAVDSAYRRAAETGNPEDFKRAQELDYGVTGTYKNELPRHDPAQAQMSAFEQRERAFNERQAAAQNRDVNGFNQSQVEGAKFSELNAKIDELLKPVAGKYPEPTMAAVKTAIQGEILQSLKSDPEWWLLHEQEFHQLMNDYRLTWTQGQPGQGLNPRIQAYKNEFLSRASRKLPSIVQKHINAATQSRTRSANGQFSGQPQNPPAAQAPQTAPATPQNGRPAAPGRMSSDQWNKEWAAQFAPFRQ